MILEHTATGELFQIVKQSNHYVIVANASGNQFLLTKCQIAYDFTRLTKGDN